MPRYHSVAVIGTGPSGVAAVKALNDENIFDTIRVFDRRDRAGGIWIYDPEPDVFPNPEKQQPQPRKIPAQLPQFTSPVSEDTTARTAAYDTLDSNVGAKAMAFTYKPLPIVNSPLSVERLGHGNPTRPLRTVAEYLEDIFQNYLHLTSFNTTVERAEKKGDKWTLTLRRSGQVHHGQSLDYWWQEHFDAVVIASGHYNVPFIPSVSGLDEAARAHPTKFEHSKSFRTQKDYVDKRVVVVGGNVSAADVVIDLHRIVKGPLYVSQRGTNEAFQFAFDLPNVERQPTLKQIHTTETGISITFANGKTIDDVDKVIFGTGYRVSYPYLIPEPITPNNRVAGFYQHLFKTGDPSLALVGQVRAGISFRIYEYQAVAVARYFAGRNAKPLPSPQEQDLWEVERLKAKGPGTPFHEIKPDFKEYYDFARELAGPPAPGTNGYELPPWDDRWAEQAFEILQLREKYWKSVRAAYDVAKARL